LDEAVVAEIAKQVPCAFTRASTDEAQLVLSGFAQPEQRVHALHGAPRNARRVIAEPHPRRGGLPSDTARRFASGRFAAACLRSVNSIPGDIGTSLYAVRDNENGAPANPEDISGTAPQISRHHEPIGLQLHVDHIVDERGAALFGQACGQRVATLATSAPPDQRDVDPVDLEARDFFDGNDASGSRKTLRV
jgi:hypothetical protein